MLSACTFARKINPVWSVTSTASGDASNSFSNRLLESGDHALSGVSPVTLRSLGKSRFDTNCLWKRPGIVQGRHCRPSTQDAPGVYRRVRRTEGRVTDRTAICDLRH